ncbi:hypothetical protein NLJ89_g11828 [Agrocybe chaxingu]|uniref:Uncharacterized protein n=1 Tax=Agrocybe chaxingu TaxID=84603 RepID=A0A9W8JW16_9AGAR|nr:hypothetical protein NLJ89_g11828 [Agrocybe chaxingu]
MHYVEVDNEATTSRSTLSTSQRNSLFSHIFTSSPSVERWPQRHIEHQRQVPLWKLLLRADPLPHISQLSRLSHTPSVNPVLRNTHPSAPVGSHSCGSRISRERISLKAAPLARVHVGSYAISPPPRSWKGHDYSPQHT